MKRYKITEVDNTHQLHVDVKTKQGYNFTLPTNKYSRALKPGKKISVIRDNDLGVLDVAVIYNGHMDLDNMVTPYANDDLSAYWEFLHDIPWVDRRIVNFYAAKEILANWQIPHLFAVLNVKQFVKLNTR